jgi:hypothetical protein
VTECLAAVATLGETNPVLHGVTVALGDVDPSFAPLIRDALLGGSPNGLAYALLDMGEVGQREFLTVYDQSGGRFLGVLGALDTEAPEVRARIDAALARGAGLRYLLQGLARFSTPLPGAFEPLLSKPTQLPPEELALVLRAASARDPDSKALKKAAPQLAKSSKDEAVRLAATIALGRTGADDRALRGILEVELRRDPLADIGAAGLLSELCERPGKPTLRLLESALGAKSLRARVLAADAARRAPELDGDLCAALVARFIAEERVEFVAVLRAVAQGKGQRGGAAAALGWVAATETPEIATVALDALGELSPDERAEAAPYLRAVARGCHGDPGALGWKRATFALEIPGANEPLEVQARPLPALDELERARALPARARALGEG